MINQRMYELGSEPSAIRELFAYGQARKAEIGEDNVFDFSIGNPSVPAPEAVKRAILDVMEQPPAQVHGYTPSQGAPSVRAAVAASLNRRFDTSYEGANIYMTCRRIAFHLLQRRWKPGRRVHRDFALFPRIQGLD